MNYIDKKVDEILKYLDCQTIEQALAKLDRLNNKSHSQMHLSAFEKKNNSEVEQNGI